MTSAPASPEIAQALQELEGVFGDRVRVEQEAGGPIVRIAAIELSSRWNPRQGVLWFSIPFHYPDAAIYPYYVTEAAPSGGLVGGLQEAEWRNMKVTQVSLRHTGWNPAVDNAVGSVLQTLDWLRRT